MQEFAVVGKIYKVCKSYKDRKYFTALTVSVTSCFLLLWSRATVWCNEAVDYQVTVTPLCCVFRQWPKPVMLRPLEDNVKLGFPVWDPRVRDVISFSVVSGLGVAANIVTVIFVCWQNGISIRSLEWGRYISVTRGPLRCYWSWCKFGEFCLSKCHM